MPLGMVVKRSGRAGGFAVGILVIVLFYVLSVMGDFWVSARILSPFAAAWFPDIAFALGDRKSTRLNSSHSQISYAVFCLKKKKIDALIYLFLVTKLQSHVSDMTRVR